MIDIIIPAYNARDTIVRTLHSIAMQENVSRLKVTIVDDCSDCGYEDIAEAFAPFLPVEVIRAEANGGPAVARQIGIDETDGDFITFIDADDTLYSSRALSVLEREIIASDLDMVGGHFLEECEGGAVVPHRDNFVWMFGKLYRRSFLDRFLIRFNDTRANEDAGFNGLVKALTRRYKFVPEMVYMWHWRENSITRTDSGAYASASGHIGYIENMIWLISEMCVRNLNKELIRREAVTILVRLYFMHMSIAYTAPMDSEDSLEAITQYYISAIKPIEQFTPPVYWQELFLEEQAKQKESTCAVIATMTFNDFLMEVRKQAKEAE